MTESWETSKMLLCTIQQHRAPRTRFTVSVNDQHRAFNTFAELKHWLLTTQRWTHESMAPLGAFIWLCSLYQLPWVITFSGANAPMILKRYGLICHGHHAAMKLVLNFRNTTKKSGVTITSMRFIVLVTLPLTRKVHVNRASSVTTEHTDGLRSEPISCCVLYHLRWFLCNVLLLLWPSKPLKVWALGLSSSVTESTLRLVEPPTVVGPSDPCDKWRTVSRTSSLTTAT